MLLPAFVPRFHSESSGQLYQCSDPGAGAALSVFRPWSWNSFISVQTLELLYQCSDPGAALSVFRPWSCFISVQTLELWLACIYQWPAGKATCQPTLSYQQFISQSRLTSHMPPVASLGKWSFLHADIASTTCGSCWHGLSKTTTP